jgi:hypothetical protein
MRTMRLLVLTALLVCVFPLDSPDAARTNSIKVVTLQIGYCSACQTWGYIFVDDCRISYNYNCELCTWGYTRCEGPAIPCYEPVGLVCINPCQ